MLCIQWIPYFLRAMHVCPYSNRKSSKTSARLQIAVPNFILKCQIAFLLSKRNFFNVKTLVSWVLNWCYFDPSKSYFIYFNTSLYNTPYILTYQKIIWFMINTSLYNTPYITSFILLTLYLNIIFIIYFWFPSPTSPEWEKFK